MCLGANRITVNSLSRFRYETSSGIVTLEDDALGFVLTYIFLNLYSE